MSALAPKLQDSANLASHSDGFRQRNVSTAAYRAVRAELAQLLPVSTHAKVPWLRNNVSLDREAIHGVVTSEILQCEITGRGA